MSSLRDNRFYRMAAIDNRAHRHSRRWWFLAGILVGLWGGYLLAMALPSETVLKPGGTRLASVEASR